MSLEFIRTKKSGNANTAIGIILLILLFVITGPEQLPRVLSRTFPFIGEGIPCSSLKRGENRAEHQSLIGRSTSDPIELEIRTQPVSTFTNTTWEVEILVINRTIGTIPILYSQEQVILGDNGSSGLGLLLEPALNLTTNAFRQNQGTVSFSEENIRLLGPRQRCVHTFEFLTGEVRANINSSSIGITAYYRINTAGQVVTSGFNPVYPDQGLRALNGYVESPTVIVPVPSS